MSLPPSSDEVSPGPTRPVRRRIAAARSRRGRRLQRARRRRRGGRTSRRRSRPSGRRSAPSRTTGRSAIRCSPTIATSGWLTSGVTKIPPSLPALVIVIVESRSSSTASVPARAPSARRRTSASMLLDRAALAAADDRDDEPVVGLHRDADVDAVEEDDLVALEPRVELGKPCDRSDATAWIAVGRAGARRRRPVKSHSSTKVTAGISRCARVTCSTIARRMPRTGTRRPLGLRRGGADVGLDDPPAGAAALQPDELDAERRRELPHRGSRAHRRRRVGRDDRDERLGGLLRRLAPDSTARRSCSPSSPITTSTAPTGATSPSSTRILSTVPARGDGISTVVLSVCTSTSG